MYGIVSGWENILVGNPTKYTHQSCNDVYDSPKVKVGSGFAMGHMETLKFFLPTLYDSKSQGCFWCNPNPSHCDRVDGISLFHIYAPLNCLRVHTARLVSALHLPSSINPTQGHNVDQRTSGSPRICVMYEEY
jgi:hypothetical protein